VGDAYRYITAFGIPLILILVSALTRKIVRKTRFIWDDFYLGVDLTLAAFSAAAVNVVDLLESTDSATAPPHVGETATLYIVACFVLFVLQVAFFQDWSDRPAVDKRKQILLLAVASNIVGIALLGFFVLEKMKGNI
jgi:hypothetical protein